jgi:hypothetical protein
MKRRNIAITSGGNFKLKIGNNVDLITISNFKQK